MFRPKNLDALLSSNSLSSECNHNDTIEAVGAVEVTALLQATLSDWVDFLFVPYPKPFVIYADHHQFITFFANSKSNLNRVVLPLVQNGFAEVADYVRSYKTK